MAKIIVNPDIFRSWFPDLQNYTDGQIEGAYAGAGSYIGLETGCMNGLSVELQTRGVYLATAHIAFLAANPDLAQGQVTSATEGSASAGFNVYQAKNFTEYMLNLTPYGKELLVILSKVQPLLPRKPVGGGYYWSFLNGRQQGKH